MRRNLTVWLALLFACTSVFAQPGNALHFDGSNDQVPCGLPAVFNNIPGNDFTMEAWVYPSGAVFSRIIFAQLNTSNFATMSTSTSNQIYFYVVSGGTNYSLVTSAAMPLNQWTHVAVRWTAATHAVACYFNGVLQTSSGGGTSSTGTSGLMTLGTRPGGAQYFLGAMDEVRIWNTARTQCEIQGNMNRHFIGPQTNLVAYYDFDHGVASGNNAGVTTLTDHSGGGYNGTLTNFALTGSTSNWIASAANITQSGNAFNGYNQNVNDMVCSGGSYTFPDGSTQTNITAPVTQTSTLTAQGGCDSVIVTSLGIAPSYSFSDTVAVCSGSSVTFPDGSTQTNITAPVTHTSNLLTVSSCDSTIVTTVEVMPTYSFVESAAVCLGGNYTYPDGSTDSNITQTTVHTSLLSTTLGCDSSIVTTVNVHPTYTQNAQDTVCSGGSYTFPDGSTQTNITSTVVHTSALQTVNSCDSTIITTVGVATVDTVVTLAGITLTASATGATFQWIDCSSGLPVAGANAASFTPTANGSYAVIVTQNGCSDTSSCHAVTVVGVDTDLATHYRLSPNPNAGTFTLDVRDPLSQTVEVDVVNSTGQVVYRAQLSGAGKHTLHLNRVAAGVYTLRVQEARQVTTLRVVIQ